MGDIYTRYSVNKKKTYESTIYITTRDASTLTSGPTIFLTNNVSKIGLFYLQQSNIPTKELEKINDIMKFNEKIMKAREKLLKQINFDDEL